MAGELSMLMPFLTLLGVIISGLYVRSKAKELKQRLIEIAREYYNEREFDFWLQKYTQGGWLIWGSPFFLAVFFVFFLVFAPLIYAPTLIRMFNDLTYLHNESAEYKKLER
jgi:hypothetical protein